MRTLLGLWNERLSSARIARALGPEFTRGAVVGKLFRLGLRRSDEQRRDAQSVGVSRSRARMLRLDAGAHPPVLPAAPLPQPSPCAVAPRLIDILQLDRCACRWPYVVGEETRFCGHRTRPESAYCPDHHAIAYFATLPPLTLESLDAVRRHPADAGAGAPIR